MAAVTGCTCTKSQRAGLRRRYLQAMGAAIFASSTSGSTHFASAHTLQNCKGPSQDNSIPSPITIKLGTKMAATQRGDIPFRFAQQILGTTHGQHHASRRCNGVKSMQSGLFDYEEKLEDSA